MWQKDPLRKSRTSFEAYLSPSESPRRHFSNIRRSRYRKDICGSSSNPDDSQDQELESLHAPAWFLDSWLLHWTNAPVSTIYARPKLLQQQYCDSWASVKQLDQTSQAQRIKHRYQIAECLFEVAQKRRPRAVAAISGLRVSRSFPGEIPRSDWGAQIRSSCWRSAATLSQAAQPLLLEWSLWSQANQFQKKLETKGKENSCWEDPEAPVEDV